MLYISRIEYGSHSLDKSMKACIIAQKKLDKSKNIGDIKSFIKTSNGYKIIKLNKKRTFGMDQLTYSFIKFSSFEKDLEKNPRFKSFFNSDIKAISLASPITHADSSCIPFFIYHGGNDKTVLIDESENLYSKLK